jgi:hypothetical protein
MDLEYANLPAWAWQPATAGDLQTVQAKLAEGKVKTNWDQVPGLRKWAKSQGWPAPWFGFKEAFLARMTEDEASFGRASAETGLEVQWLHDEHTIGEEELQSLDGLLEEGHNRLLVEELRSIR